VLELTIEDPAEAFEDLRDKNDLKMLLANSAFTSEGAGTSPTPSGKSGLGPPADKAWVERWRITFKIAKVGYSRCCAPLALNHSYVAAIPKTRRDDYFAFAATAGRQSQSGLPPSGN